MTFHLDALIRLLLAWFPVTLVHELGHYLVGRALGDAGGIIRFGSPGDRAVTVPLGRLTISFHLGPGLWLVPPACLRRGVRSSTPQGRLAFALGGPALSLVLCLLLQDGIRAAWQHWLAWLADRSLPPPGDSWISALSLWAPWALVVPLIPRRYRSTGLESDGLQALRALQALLGRRRGPDPPPGGPMVSTP